MDSSIHYRATTSTNPIPLPSIPTLHETFSLSLSFSPFLLLGCTGVALQKGDPTPESWMHSKVTLSSFLCVVIAACPKRATHRLDQGVDVLDVYARHFYSCALHVHPLFYALHCEIAHLLKIRPLILPTICQRILARQCRK